MYIELQLPILIIPFHLIFCTQKNYKAKGTFLLKLSSNWSNSCFYMHYIYKTEIVCTPRRIQTCTLGIACHRLFKTEIIKKKKKKKKKYIKIIKKKQTNK